MRELKKGTDLSDLVEMVIVADKDNDDDYYVAVRLKHCTSEGDPRTELTSDDERSLSQFYMRDYRLVSAIASTEQAVVAEALTRGDITDIEAFLEA